MIPVRAVALIALVGATSLAWAADPVAYTVRLRASGDSAADAAMAASSSLVRLRTLAPVSAFALISRAQGDADRFLTGLHSEGYYDGAVRLTIAGRPADDPALPGLLESSPAGISIPVDIQPSLGPQFRIGRVQIRGPMPIAPNLALAPGQPARAAPILAAGAALLTRLQDEGYALARVPAPVVTLDEGQRRLNVAFTVEPGPRVAIGPITLSGLTAVDPAFVRRRLLLRSGERYNPDRIEAARRDLASLGVFASVRAEPGTGLGPDRSLPLTFGFTERPRHVVSFGVAYSTDLGGSVHASWTNRNLFGRAEQLTLSLAATELGGSAAKQPGYNAAAQFIKPDWLRRDQSLQFDVLAVREYLEAYDRTALTADALATRKLSAELSTSVGVSATRERVTQEGVTRNYTFAGLPLGLKYDTTGSLLAPSHGVRAAFTVTPTESFASGRGGGAGAATYVLLTATGSRYLDLGPPGRRVLAIRATIGASEGTTQFGLPPDQRFYAGGSATIRGYTYQYASPQFADNKPAGGTSLDAATLEYRQRFGQSYGAAVFVDAGQVGVNGVPFSGPLRVGAGVGARYYTAIGPIRLDLAVPLAQVPGNGAFEAYIGIGEAF